MRYSFKDLWKRWLAGCFDAVGRILWFPLKWSRRPLDLSSVTRILVIRMDHIGDVVMSRPAIRALHKKFPHAAIDFLVTEDIAPLFEDSKEIRAVIPVKYGWFSRKSSFMQKWSEFWRLVNILKCGVIQAPRHSERSEESQKRDPSSSAGLSTGLMKNLMWLVQSCLPSIFKKKQDRMTATKPYDVGIDLRGDIRNILLMSLVGIRHTIGYGTTGGGFLLNEEIPHDAAQHQVRLALGLLNSFLVAQDNKLLPFEYSPERARQFWKKIETLPPTTLLPRIVIHMGSGYPSKRWPFENFAALVQKIDREALAQIVLIGTEAEKDAAPDLKLNSERLIDLRGKTELRDLPVLFDVCDVFVGNDSGPAHIAAAQGLEIILLASGTNDIRLWYPWTERLSILQHTVPCSPCEAEICPVEGHPCVEQITVDHAFDAVLSVLSRLQKKS